MAVSLPITFCGISLPESYHRLDFMTFDKTTKSVIFRVRIFANREAALAGEPALTGFEVALKEADALAVINASYEEGELYPWRAAYPVLKAMTPDNYWGCKYDYTNAIDA